MLSRIPPTQEGMYQQPAMIGVPVAQPPMAPQPGSVLPQGPWMTGLYDCDCNDDECCMTCFCPCITFGRIAEILDKGSTSSCASSALYALICVTGFLPLFSCFYRYKLRQEYRLREEPCADCCVHCWCECCSLCQMYRELKRRGFDMNIGWYANLDRRGMPTQTATAPPVHEEMKR